MAKLMKMQDLADLKIVTGYLLRLGSNSKMSAQRDKLMITMAELLRIEYELKDERFAKNPMRFSRKIKEANSFLQKLDKSGIITFLELQKEHNNG